MYVQVLTERQRVRPSQVSALSAGAPRRALDQERDWVTERPERTRTSRERPPPQDTPWSVVARSLPASMVRGMSSWRAGLMPEASGPGSGGWRVWCEPGGPLFGVSPGAGLQSRAPACIIGGMLALFLLVNTALAWSIEPKWRAAPLEIVFTADPSVLAEEEGAVAQRLRDLEESYAREVMAWEAGWRAYVDGRTTAGPPEVDAGELAASLRTASLEAGPLGTYGTLRLAGLLMDGRARQCDPYQAWALLKDHDEVGPRVMFAWLSAEGGFVKDPVPLLREVQEQARGSLGGLALTFQLWRHLDWEDDRDELLTLLGPMVSHPLFGASAAERWAIICLDKMNRANVRACARAQPKAVLPLVDVLMGWDGYDQALATLDQADRWSAPSRQRDQARLEVLWQMDASRSVRMLRSMARTWQQRWGEALPTREPAWVPSYVLQGRYASTIDKIASRMTPCLALPGTAARVDATFTLKRGVLSDVAMDSEPFLPACEADTPLQLDDERLESGEIRIHLVRIPLR